jgi:pyruvyltransferase
MQPYSGRLSDLPRNFRDFAVTRLQNKPYQYIRYFNAIPNWGDHINPYIIQKMTGKNIIESTFGMSEHIIAIGSIFGKANRNSIIWGTGFISKTSSFKEPPKKITAVRGPLTGSRLEELGCKNPKIYGDPALLMPRFYSPKVKKKYSVGLVAHYAEKNDAVVNYLGKLGVHMVDIQLPVEEFIDELCQCEAIISSSLHGLIAADAYGIRNRWLKLSDKLVGGEFKFQDYYNSIGSFNERPLMTKELMSVKSIPELFDVTNRKNVGLNLDKLYNAFPF